MRWVEVKNINPFRVGSETWDGLWKQLETRMRVAQDPQYHFNGKTPEMVVHFAKGASEGVINALRSRGVIVEIGSK